MKVQVKRMRDPRQRQAYAMRRMSLACDRVIRKKDTEQAARWVRAWARVAQV